MFRLGGVCFQLSTLEMKLGGHSLQGIDLVFIDEELQIGMIRSEPLLPARRAEETSRAAVKDPVLMSHIGFPFCDFSHSKARHLTVQSRQGC